MADDIDDIDLGEFDATVTSKLVLAGTAIALLHSEKITNNLKAIVSYTAIDLIYRRKVDEEVVNFLKYGEGTLFTDTLLGLEAARILKESKNRKVAIIFLRPEEDFVSTAELLALGEHILGVWSEQIGMDDFSEIVRLATVRASAEGIEAMISINQEGHSSYAEIEEIRQSRVKKRGGSNTNESE